jgi:hypothetical protein
LYKNFENGPAQTGADRRRPAIFSTPGNFSGAELGALPAYL